MKHYLFETLGGSHLYGLANANSDIDTFRSYTGTMGHSNRKGKQRISGEDDSLEMPLGAWMTQANKGTPQALEHLWSPIAKPSPLDAMRFNFRPNTALAADSYHNAILSIFRIGSNAEDAKKYKMYRHALRLTWNLNELLTNGMFNPRMPDSAAALATEMAMENAYSEQAIKQMLARESMIPLYFR